MLEMCHDDRYQCVYMQTYPIFVDIGLTVDVDPNAVQSKNSHGMSDIGSYPIYLPDH